MESTHLKLLLAILIISFCAMPCFAAGRRAFRVDFPYFDALYDDFFQYNEFNYTFWLISSLIFLWLWTLQFKYPILVYLSLVEMIILIIAYMLLISQKQECIKRQKKMRKEMKRKKLELLDRSKNFKNLKE